MFAPVLQCALGVKHRYREQGIMSAFKDIYGVLQLSALVANHDRNSHVRSTSLGFPILWDTPFVEDPQDHFYEKFWRAHREQALAQNPIVKGQLQ